jgi:hypothetical protein
MLVVEVVDELADEQPRKSVHESGIRRIPRRVEDSTVGGSHPCLLQQRGGRIFNGTLKVERVNRTSYPTKEHARRDMAGTLNCVTISADSIRLSDTSRRTRPSRFGLIGSQQRRTPQIQCPETTGRLSTYHPLGSSMACRTRSAGT